MTSINADLSPLFEWLNRRRAMRKLLSSEALDDYSYHVPENARNSLADDLKEGVPTDEIVAGLRNEHGLSPKTELQTRLRVEENRDNVEDILKADMLKKAGVDSRGYQAARKQRELESLAGRLTPGQYANVLNAQDAAPYRMSGGAVYDRYRGGIQDETSALRAQALERMFSADENAAQAEEQRLRNSGLRPILTSPNADPLLRADVANSKEVADAAPETVTVVDGDGQRSRRTVRRRPDNTYEYTEVQDNQNQGIRLANDHSDDNTRQVKADITVWRQAVGDALRELKEEPRFRNRTVDRQTLEARALEIYRLLQNDSEAQAPASASTGDIVQDLTARGSANNGNGSGGGRDPAADDPGHLPGTDQPVEGPLSDLSLQQWTHLKQARRAIQNNRDPAAVRRKLRELGIEPSLLDLLTPAQ